MDLVDIAKSQVKGLYTPITAMNKKQLAHLRHEVSAKKGARLHGGRKPAIGGSLANTRAETKYRGDVHTMTENAAEVQDKELAPSANSVKSISGASKRLKLKKQPSVVGTPLLPPGQLAAAGKIGNRRAKGIVYVPSAGLHNGSTSPDVAVHEIAHLKKKGGGWRNFQINQNKTKAAREEARADSERFHAYPFAERSGYEAAARGSTDSVDWSPKQMSAYRSVRRKTGTWWG